MPLFLGLPLLFSHHLKVNFPLFPSFPFLPLSTWPHKTHPCYEHEDKFFLSSSSPHGISSIQTLSIPPLRHQFHCPLSSRIFSSGRSLPPPRFIREILNMLSTQLFRSPCMYQLRPREVPFGDGSSCKCRSSIGLP